MLGIMYSEVVIIEIKPDRGNQALDHPEGVYSPSCSLYCYLLKNLII